MTPMIYDEPTADGLVLTTPPEDCARPQPCDSWLEHHSLGMASQDAVSDLIDALTELYRTWVRMACLPEDDLIIAPAEGHALLPVLVPILEQHKTDGVAQLIKRMPYYRTNYDRPGVLPVTCPELTPCARVQDYWNQPELGGLDDLWLQQLYQPDFDPEKSDPPPVLASELPWTRDPAAGGYAVVIDTASPDLLARVYPKNWQDCTYDHRAPGVGPCHWLCRGKAVQTVPAAELFRSYTQLFRSAEWMPNLSGAWQVVTLDSEVDWIERYHQAYIDCGWPDSFDSDKLMAYRESEDFYADFFGEDSDESDA